jgi:hypothetical protein
MKKIIEFISGEIKQIYANVDITVINIFNIECRRQVPGLDTLMPDLNYVDSSPHILFESDQLIISDEDIFLNHEIFLYQEETLLRFEDSPSSSADGWVEGDWEKIDITKDLPEELIAVFIGGLKRKDIEVGNFIGYIGNKENPDEFLLKIKNVELREAYKALWEENKEDYF